MVLELLAPNEDHPRPHIVHSALRASTLQLMEELVASPLSEYCVAAERCVFALWRNNRSAYTNICRRLIYALHTNREYLTTTFDATSLVGLDYSVLGSGQVDSWYKEYNDRQSREKILYTGALDDDDSQQKDVEGMVRCSRCKSSDVSWDQKQTRGADESMTVFFECKACGKRWKMC